MDIVKLGSTTLSSSDSSFELDLDIDTVNKFTLHYLYFNISKKVDQNNIRATVTVNGNFVISDSLISLDKYKTQILKSTGYSAGVFGPNAPLFVSFVPQNSNSQGIPIYGRYVTNLTVRLSQIDQSGTKFTDLTIESYGVGRYNQKPYGFQSHFNIERYGGLISKTSEYEIAGSNLLGIGYVNFADKSFPDVELLADNTNILRLADHSRTGPGPLPELASSLTSVDVTTPATADILSGVNTLTKYSSDLNANTSYGQSLPFHTNEFTDVLGGNQRNQYISQTWGMLTRYAPIKPVNFTYKLSGKDFTVMPYYTRYFTW